MKAFSVIAAFVFTVINQSAQAATMDEYITCSLVYGALFQASKNADHEGMLIYTRPRLQAVLPFLQKNGGDPVAKEHLKDIAKRLEDEVKTYVHHGTNAILDDDPEKLKATMPRIFQCDRVFGLSTLPLPLKSKLLQTTEWNEFLGGFNGGCLTKQRRNPSPFSDANIQIYCRCMTDQAAKNGINENSTEQIIGRVIKESHGGCLARIQ